MIVILLVFFVSDPRILFYIIMHPANPISGIGSIVASRYLILPEDFPPAPV